MEQKQPELNQKAQKFQAFLTENKINAFSVETAADEMQSAIFRSRMEVSGQELPTVVVIDNSIYVMVRVQIVAGAVQEQTRAAVLAQVNQLNGQYKVFKYYVSDKGDLYLDACLPCLEETFNGELVRTVINVMLQHLTEAYPTLMRSVWAK